MVTVVNFKPRVNEAGDEFFVLVIHGDLEMVRSSETGNYYATAKKSTVTCTFDESSCEQLLGKQIPGSINKVECEPYQYTLESGEKITLEHRYEYSPDATSVEETVFQGEVLV